MNNAWLVEGVRTPFGRYGGALGGVRADDLAALPVRELISRHPEISLADVDDVIMGNANGAGEENRNLGRMAALLAGLPDSVPGVAVNRLCGSGGEAVVEAARQVRCGDSSVVIAGGAESMTRAPFVIPKPDRAFPTHLEAHATTLGWRMVNPVFPTEWSQPLGRCVELLAAEYGISRTAQDEWALRSHQRAAEAWRSGQVGSVVPIGAGIDESIRTATSMSRLGELPSAFSPTGSVTAGNSSPLSDGAVAALIVGDEVYARLEAPPTARITGATVIGCEPTRFATAPVAAIRRLCGRMGLGLADFDVVELNEAFAAMVLCCLTDLPELDPEKVNRRGGAIAIGHPLGASFARVVVDLCSQLRDRGGGRGIAAACIGVGQGLAIACEVTERPR